MSSVSELPPVDSVDLKDTPKSSLHLTYLDGLRGLAAFWVVLCHIYATVQGPWNNGHVPGRVLGLLGWMGGGGHLAVNIFIVLSGYCLMLPVARSEGHQLSGGLLGFFRRRALRILPPYYAALGLSLALIACIPTLGRAGASYWDQSLPAFRTDVLVSHVLLVHNVLFSWKSKIDYPMWSVATEWQIYFVFALALLPLWRRFGMAITLMSALCLGLIPHFVLHNDDACFHFLFSFALGMAAARLNFGSRRRIPRQQLSAVTVLLWLVTFAVILFRSGLFARRMIFMDIMTGMATAMLLFLCTEALQQQRNLPVLRLLQARGAVLMGTFSYSLYLVHAPVLALLHSGLRAQHANWAVSYAVMLGVGIPACLTLSYLFHLAFERPFMRLPKKQARVRPLVPVPQEQSIT